MTHEVRSELEFACSLNADLDRRPNAELNFEVFIRETRGTDAQKRQRAFVVS